MIQNKYLGKVFLILIGICLLIFGVTVNGRLATLERRSEGVPLQPLATSTEGQLATNILGGVHAWEDTAVTEQECRSKTDAWKAKHVEDGQLWGAVYLKDKKVCIGNIKTSNAEGSTETRYFIDLGYDESSYFSCSYTYVRDRNGAQSQACVGPQFYFKCEGDECLHRDLDDLEVWKKILVLATDSVKVYDLDN